MIVCDTNGLIFTCDRSDPLSEPEKREGPISAQTIQGAAIRVAERRSLVVTTNLPFARWAEVFLDATAAVAVADRIVHRATVLTTRRRQLAQAPAGSCNNANKRVLSGRLRPA